MNKHYSLVGIDGNAYAIMGYVLKAMKENGFEQQDRDNYLKNAKSSDYNHLIYVSAQMIEDINGINGEDDEALDEDED